MSREDGKSFVWYGGVEFGRGTENVGEHFEGEREDCGD